MGVYEDCAKMERSETHNTGTPMAAQDGMSYRGSRTPPEAHDGVVLQLTGAASAARNGVETLSGGVPPATTRNAVPYASAAHPVNGMGYADWLTVHLAPGATLPPNGRAYPDVVMENFTSSVAPVIRSGASYPDLLTAHLGPGASPGPGNGEPYPDMLMAHLSSDMSPAIWNSVAYPGSGAALTGGAYSGGLSADTMPPDTSTVRYPIDVYEGVADFGFGHFHPAGAEEDAGYYNNSGMALPFAAQVVDNGGRGGLVADAAPVAQDEVPGAVAGERVRGGLGYLGLAATSLAVAGLTAGGAGAATPATAFALFATLLGGVTLTAVRVFRA